MESFEFQPRAIDKDLGEGYPIYSLSKLPEEGDGYAQIDYCLDAWGFKRSD